MPEGDTIHKLAAAMRPDLVGEVVERVRIGDRPPVASLAGEVVDAVEALGKHLLIGLGSDWVLHTHLGMHGSWHRYRPDEPWKRPRRLAGAQLATDRLVFVCFRPSQVELVPRGRLASHPVLSRLGPDLLAADLDVTVVLRRARAPGFRERPIGEVLLDQTVAAGIGNVYKSEVLFLTGIHPEAPVESVGEESLRRVFLLARELMQANLGPGKRRTTTRRPEGGLPQAPPHTASPFEPLWVYHRRGRPCLVCGSPIEGGRQGDMARVTYWCPRCQAR